MEKNEYSQKEDYCRGIKQYIKVQPAAKFISGYDISEDKFTTNCYPLRSETFSTFPYCVVSKVKKITRCIEFIDPPRMDKHCSSVDTKYVL